MSEDEIDWLNGKNIPRDAVQYWGVCKNCGKTLFVDARCSFCVECVFKVKPVIPPRPELEVEETEASPWNGSDEVTVVEPVIERPVVETPKSTKPPFKKGRKSPVRAKSQPAKNQPAKYSGPVGEWLFDEQKKGWVMKDELGRAVKFSKEKP